MYMAFSVDNFLENVPTDFNDVSNRPDNKRLFSAIEREIYCANKNNIWSIIEKPDNVQILDTKWVLSYKPFEKSEVDKYKARLVVRGFAQHEF